MKNAFMKRMISFLITLVTLVGVFVVMPTEVAAISYSDTSLSAMISRAEEIVNYKWTPSSDIKTWNGNTYNGKNYFPKGLTVTGVPYTLFTSEVGKNSLVSLADYKGLASSNYSASAYCVSVGANRTGPVYGSCCADFICEVFGGVFMNGNQMRYHNTGIRNSDYVTRVDNARVKLIQAGDALCSSDFAHIIWIGDITSTTMTVYEQTPPVARKVVINKPSGDSTLKYYGRTYNIIVRSKQITQNMNQKYWLDVNSVIGNTVHYDSSPALASMDVYVNGVKVANDTSDFYQQVPAGSTYKVTDIKSKNGYVLTGQTTYSGTIWSDVNVNIPFSKAASGFTCNFRMKAGSYVACYDDLAMKSYAGRIYNNDTITVLEVYPSTGVFKVSCPWDGGYNRIVYASFTNFPIRLTQYVNAYDSNWSKVGRGYPNDNCKVLAITSSYVKLACPWSENGRSYTKEIYVRPSEIMG